jgi:hypothetical protein
MWKLVDPLAIFFFVVLILKSLQTIKDHAIGPLNLTIGSWVGN